MGIVFRADGRFVQGSCVGLPRVRFRLLGEALNAQFRDERG